MKMNTLEYGKNRNFESIAVSSKANKRLSLRITGKDLLLMISAFLMGRTPIAAEALPLGVIFFTSSRRQDINRFFLAIMISIGMLAGGKGRQVFTALAGIILFSFFSLFIKWEKSKKGYIYSILASVSILIPQIIYIYSQGFLLYDLLMALLCGVAAFFLNHIFKNAFDIIENISSSRIFKGEEIIYVAILGVLVFSGLSGIKLLGFSLDNIICILFLLMMCYKFGGVIGAAVGLVFGLITVITTDITPMAIGSYAICGLLSGLFNKMGKVGSSLGFVIGNTLLTVYLSGSAHALSFLKDLVAATGLFLVLPVRFIENLVIPFKSAYTLNEGSLGYEMRIREATVDKLNKYASAFREMSKTFDEISDLKTTIDKEDLSAMFDRVAEKVCKDCSLCRHCWDRNFYSTYQVLFKIIDALDSKGRISEEDIPQYFIDRCERIQEFVEAVNNTFEIFKVDLVWKNRIGESRGLISQQLFGLSRIIENLSSEIASDIHFKKDLEEAIAKGLKNSGIVKTCIVNVFESKGGRYNVVISHKGCAGKRLCTTSIIRQVERITGRRMAKESENCKYNHKNGYCNLKLVEEEPFGVITAVARAPKAGFTISGDNYAFLNNGEGKYFVALSDGMGTGHKAHLQSKATVNLLEQFIESGFDKDISVRLINSLLLLKSGDDSFATIDLSVIDLYSGNVEFVKVGAVPTFIKKGTKVEIVRSASLPAGILSNIEYELIHKNMDDGDILIMMTDGVYDSFKDDDNDNDNILIGYIQSLNSINPQEIADSILDQAYYRSGGTPDDDMLVVSAKVWKKAVR
ncbi:MAG TPA: stage II sporulation protein E [Clostridiaceae bacterium]|nr:stage II sporulation protein E [Clostridiaceae bacterium]